MFPAVSSAKTSVFDAMTATENEQNSHVCLYINETMEINDFFLVV